MKAALDQARTLRDAGMGAAADAEDRRQPEFAVALYAAIVAVARRQATVHVDDVLPLVAVRAKHFNAAGTVWRKAIREGVILATGRTRTCAVDKRKHAHGSPVYRSMLFGRTRAAVAPNPAAASAPTASRQLSMFEGSAP